MEQQISVTRALTELKRLDGRITNAIGNGTFVSLLIGRGNNQKPINSNDTKEDKKRQIQKSFDQVTSLIKNYQNLKSAIILSNASTYVTIAGEKKTVAEVIEMKNSIEYMKSFHECLRSSYVAACNNRDNINQKLEESIDNLLAEAIRSEKGKFDKSVEELISNSQRDQKEANLLDPIKIEDKISFYRDKVETFLSEVDFVLSESNARTMITVDLTEQ